MCGCGSGGSEVTEHKMFGDVSFSSLKSYSFVYDVRISDRSESV